MSYHLSAGPYDRNTFNDIYDDVKGSLPMYSVHEALARDRMREAEQRSAAVRLGRTLSAHRRWRRAALRAKAAEERLAREASDQLTQLAVAR